MPPELAGVEEFARLLARALRQFRTYPATNPRCADAVAACHRALAAQTERGRLVFRVHPRELLVDDTRLGAGTIIEHEIARRLHRAHVGALTVDCAASPRDLARFCRELVDALDRDDPYLTITEVLAERGVDKIVPIMTRRPEVFDIGVPGPERRTFLAIERERRSAMAPAPGTASYLYPPDRGFIRLDPSASVQTVSLADLAILVDDPRDLATMLMRMTDDVPAGDARDAALEQKFSDVATLFASLDPRLARLMFSRLARAVLALDGDRRLALLRRTVLPGLLDGRPDGRVLNDFPDVDLADSLCLLLDLETAAPEVVTSALDRLDLSEERRLAVLPLLESRLHSRTADDAPSGTAGQDHVDRHTQRLVKVDAAQDKNFTDLAAFDLAMDAAAEAAVVTLRADIAATDALASRLDTLWHLVRLEPNPSLVESLLNRAVPVLGALEGARRWRELSAWLVRFRQLAETLQEPRPDVAVVVAAACGSFFTPDRVRLLTQLYEADAASQTVAGRLVQAAGPSIAASLVAAFGDTLTIPQARTLTQLMCDHAGMLAPALAGHLPAAQGEAARAVVKVLGHAGSGFERILGNRLPEADEGLVRDILRALTRIGSPLAAELVAAQLLGGAPTVRRAAEEALWHLPQKFAHAQVRTLLGREAFYRKHPQDALRLLERAARTTTEGLEPVLQALVPMRHRLWNPPLARLGRAARALLSA